MMDATMPGPGPESSVTMAMAAKLRGRGGVWNGRVFRLSRAPRIGSTTAARYPSASVRGPARRASFPGAGWGVTSLLGYLCDAKQPEEIVVPRYRKRWNESLILDSMPAGTP